MISEKMGEFERRRMQHKSSILSGCLVFFKSTVGFGLVSSQYFFGKAGLFLGILTTIISCLVIWYTMKLIVQAADDIETNENIEIENYDQITSKIFGYKMTFITKAFCFLFNEGIVLVNITNLANFLQSSLTDYLPVYLHDSEFFKVIIIIVFIILLVFILEPEMIKYPSYVAAFVLLLATVTMWIMSLVQYIKNSEPKNYNDFSILNFPALIGNQLYAFESIGTLFTVRSTLANRTDMHKVLAYTFVLIFSLFAINGISFLVVTLLDVRRIRFAKDGF